jgi:phenylacetate-coenzyme A ligase PaaK-like adenylate-forming protein
LAAVDDIPFIDESTLDRHYYTSFDDEPKHLHCYSTSGTSTGRRKRIWYSDEEEQFYVSEKCNLFRNILAQEDGFIPYQRAVADMGTGHAAATAKVIFNRLGMECHSIPFSAPITEHLELLERERPEVLYTMPSILEQLLYAATDVSVFGIRKLILVGEVCTPAWREQMAAAFNIELHDITDTYGSIEIGTIAFFCHKIGRYVLMDQVLAEGIRDGFELADDETVLVLTAMQRTNFPALRYITNDVVRDLREMELAGRRCMTFAALTRRSGNEFKHGEKISLYDIEQTVCEIVSDGTVRVLIRDDRKLCVFVHSRSLLDDDVLDRIRYELQRRIVEIGMMIDNGLIGSIEVVAAEADTEWFVHQSRKMKKIWR